MGLPRKACAFLCLCFERPRKKSIKPTQHRSSVIQTIKHSNLDDLLLIANVNSARCRLLCITQSKHRHVPSIMHFAAPEKKLKSNMIYNFLRVLVIKYHCDIVKNCLKMHHIASQRIFISKNFRRGHAPGSPLGSWWPDLSPKR